MLRWKFIVASVLSAVFFMGTVMTTGAIASDLTVFAAASTTNALEDIAAAYEKAGKGKVALSFGSSSTLAKQIEHGAPAALFVSANEDWMNYLDEKNLLEKGTRKDLLGNSVVLIVPAASSVQSVTVDKNLDLAAILGKDGKLSVGDPAHVPVGMYGKAALEHLGLWNQVAERIAPTKDVRAALLLVEKGEAPLGIVYASDAAISKDVRIIGTFPASSHPKVDYPVAVIAANASDKAKDFMAFMANAESKEIWKKYGFEVR